MEQPVEDVITTAFSLHYEQPYKVNIAICDLKAYFTDYEVKKASYRCDDDDDTEELLLICIRLPLPNIGKRVPLSIRLPVYFPRVQPVVQFIRSDTAFINPACHVDENNIIHHSYLDNWTEDSTLADLLQSLMIDFMDLFPVFDLADFKNGKSASDTIKTILQLFPDLKPSWRRTASAVNSLVLKGPVNARGRSVLTVSILITSHFPEQPAEVLVTYTDGYVTEHTTAKPQGSLVEYLRRLAGDSNSPGASTTHHNRAPTPAPRGAKSPSSVPEEVHSFIQSADLSESTETELIKKGFTSLRAIRCLQDGDVDKLELSLAEMCLLKDALHKMRRDQYSDSGKFTANDDTRRGSHEITSNALCQGVRRHLQQVMVTEKQLTIGEKLGNGHSGVVYKGQLRIKDNSDPETVAVKTIAVSGSFNDKDVEDFIPEILQTSMLKHKNILELKAIALISDIPHLVLPFMANGDLLTYVKSPGRHMILSNFVKLALDIAHGMKYLHDHRIVHCDLAARNCLVDGDGTVKVSDFGLSRKLHLYDYTRLTDKKIALRWMAPEVHKTAIFTLKSDLWSYSIVLWEIFTRGRKPYDEIPVTLVSKHIISGGLLSCPDSAPNNIREIMLSCWQMEPDNRPDFSDIITSLNMQLQDSSRQSSTDPGMVHTTATRDSQETTLTKRPL